MRSEAVDQVLRMIEDSANSTPSAIEFEMAYQSRVAIDRIRFAINATEYENRSRGLPRSTVLAGWIIGFPEFSAT